MKYASRSAKTSALAGDNPPAASSQAEELAPYPIFDYEPTERGRYRSRSTHRARPVDGLVRVREGRRRYAHAAAIGAVGALTVVALNLVPSDELTSGEAPTSPVPVKSGSDAAPAISESPGDVLASPSWSPDRPRIAFLGPALSGTALHVGNADGTGQMLLSEGDQVVASPAWSPDGRIIAFTGYRDGDGDIYVINGDGTGRLRLTATPGFDLHPAWSPDGARIAFTSGRDGTAEVYVMDSDGRQQTRLHTPGDCSEPAWSRGGELAIVCRTDDYTTTIYVGLADGTGWRAVTDGLGFESRPKWSGDDATLEFTSDGRATLVAMA